MVDPQLGVVIVTYNSADVIAGCLESLLAAAGATGHPLRIVVVDNASGDDTLEIVRAWACGAADHALPKKIPFEMAAVPKPVPIGETGQAQPGQRVRLVRSDRNTGFAGGVNQGLAHLAADPDVAHFWVLNPDSMVPAEALAALAARLKTTGPYALLGGRVLYMDRPDTVQIDGGMVDWRTGNTINHNLGLPATSCQDPAPEKLDFIMGASMVASRAFYKAAGPMPEDYFLYYEEVDWALRRGDLPLVFVPGFTIYHVAGSAIGSPNLDRGASPFSLYFKHRGRIRFLWRFRPTSLPLAFVYSLAKATRLIRRGRRKAAAEILRGSFGLRPGAEVAARLSPAALAQIASKSERTQHQTRPDIREAG